MTFRFMVDFSKVARQLDNLKEALGEGGGIFEKRIAPQILQNMNPDGNFISAPGQKIKTDIIDEKGGNPADNDHYSIKWKRDNDFGYKTHQTSAQNKIWRGRDGKSKMSDNLGHFKGLFSKFLSRAPGDTPGKYAGDIQQDLVRQALILKFGSHIGSIPQFRNVLAQTKKGGKLSEKQLNFLSNLDNDQERQKTNPFLTTEEMDENFPDQFEALRNHLESNKKEIFDRLVRKNGFQNGDYSQGDPSPVNKHLSFIKDGASGWNGTAQVRDISNERVEEAMQKLKWFFKDNKIYLNDSEEEDVARRLLEIHPIDLAGSNWALQPNGSDADSAGVLNGIRESVGKGIIQPGHFKSSMSANKEILDKYFPVEWQKKISDNGGNLTFEDIIEKAEDEGWTDPKPSKPGWKEPEKPAQQSGEKEKFNRFGNFMMKAAGAAGGMVRDLQQRANRPERDSGVERFIKRNKYK